MKPERILIDGVPLDALDREGLLSLYASSLRAGHDSVFVGFYAALLRRASVDRQYRLDVSRSDVIYADGAGAVLGLRWLAKSKRVERLATTDIWRDLVSIGADSGVSVAVVASDQNTLAIFRKAVEQLGAHVAYSRNGYFSSPEEWTQAAKLVRQSGAGLVLVGMGAGSQERFVRTIVDEMPNGGPGQVFFTMGGLADHVAGRTRRAPSLVQKAGFEWLWRTIQEPRRLMARYVVGNAYFLWRVCVQVLASRRRGAAV
ncbi:hypothetical protein DBR36_09845 [Microbacterium sp. HMWF026]|uniref:WecB/TagA/CpsF family glycosyltransferase n=1 Tax=Microbacterium sp. HMWF026 TaxID=2056861 RepID=UPI000D3B67E5|nr:WecB/TagA/CpsF family glycosyltransferase [Microbacterium sp. HMWF026]PTT17946.1 hypothetical protein DBR36_09845 [Microbacterium sp. HMWF026]